MEDTHMQKLASLWRVLIMVAAITAGGWALAPAKHDGVTAAALSRQASSCRVAIRPQPQKVPQGGVEAIQFTSLPGTPLTVIVLTASTYPTTGTVYSGGDPAVTGTIATGTPAPDGGLTYLLTAGRGGRATLRIAVPSTLAPPKGTQVLGSVMVTSTCRGATITKTAPFLYERAALAKTSTLRRARRQ